MFNNKVWLGPVPPDEAAAQTTSAEFSINNEIECRVFQRMLKRLFPVPETVQARITVKSATHDFGTYREVVVAHDDDARSSDFACMVERECPPKWDDIAQAELAWFQEQYRYRRLIREGVLTEAQVPGLFLQLDPPAELPAAARVYALRPSRSYTRESVVISESWVIVPTDYGNGRIVSELHPSGDLVLRLLDEHTSEPLATVTCILRDTVYVLAADEVFVKTWSENEALRTPLLATGLFVDTGVRERTGFVAAEVWRLTPAFMAQMSLPNHLKRAA